jgi:hypothetical protein
MAKPLAVAAALLLVALGVFLLIAVSYTPQLLGFGDEVGLLLALMLRGLGLLLFLGAAYLLVWARRKE